MWAGEIFSVADAQLFQGGNGGLPFRGRFRRSQGLAETLPQADFHLLGPARRVQMPQQFVVQFRRFCSGAGAAARASGRSARARTSSMVMGMARMEGSDLNCAAKRAALTRPRLRPGLEGIVQLLHRVALLRRSQAKKSVLRAAAALAEGWEYTPRYLGGRMSEMYIICAEWQDSPRALYAAGPLG